MKLIIIFYGITAGFAFGQLNLRPFVKTGGAINFYLRNGPITAQVNLSGGVHFNDHFALQVGAERIVHTFRNWDILIASIEPTYRIFNREHVFSPVIGIAVGTELTTNATDRFITEDYGFVTYGVTGAGSSGSKTRYKKGVFFGKGKVLADFKIKDFNISVGPTFDMMFIKEESFKYYIDSKVYIAKNYGIGAELSFMYTFPMKKREAKKGLE